jgi:hypothetical protein
MKKLLLLSIIILTSCGSEKSTSKKLKQKTETKTEVTENVKSMDSSKVETNENYSNRISSESFIKDFTFEPIDNSNPYFVGGKEFHNVKVVNKESNIKLTQEVDFLRNQIDQRFIQTETERNTIVLELKELKSRLKESERKAGFTGAFVSLSILLLILIIGYFIYNRYK